MAVQVEITDDSQDEHIRVGNCTALLNMSLMLTSISSNDCISFHIVANAIWDILIMSIIQRPLPISRLQGVGLWISLGWTPHSLSHALQDIFDPIHRVFSFFNYIQAENTLSSVTNDLLQSCHYQDLSQNNAGRHAQEILHHYRTFEFLRRSECQFPLTNKCNTEIKLNNILWWDFYKYCLHNPLDG